MRLLNKDILEINSTEKLITSDPYRVEKKLKPVLGITTQDEIRKEPHNLSSQQYVASASIEVVYQSIESKCLGKFELEEEEYGSIVRVGTNDVRITLYWADADVLLSTLDHADKLMAECFYEKALRIMYSSMLELKNDYWIEEEEDNDTEPTVLTLDEFKHRITILEITFNHDHTATIVCDADGMFAEHTITVNTDTRGNYKEAVLTDLAN